MVDPVDATLSRLRREPPDALLAVMTAYRADPRLDKVDLGVGVFRDASGGTPVMRAVKEAERRLHKDQTSKGYLAPEGDAQFVERLTPLIFGEHIDSKRIRGLQTPGGTGALRTAGELIARARPDARIHLGVPTWPNHEPLLGASGLVIAPFPFFDPVAQTLRFDRLLAVLEAAAVGDVVLLHGCCHNPTGADLSLEQWATVAETMAHRGLLPLIDFAYHGLGKGLDADAEGVRLVVRRCPATLLAYSCDKNMGLYRDRVGALFVCAEDAERAEIALSNMLALTRANWSMPPDHGAAVARVVLSEPDLAALWRDELSEMRKRLFHIRSALAARYPCLTPLAHQHGLFAQLPLKPEEVTWLREEQAIYVAGSGRVNLAGLTQRSLDRFGQAVTHLYAASPRKDRNPHVA